MQHPKQLREVCLIEAPEVNLPLPCLRLINKLKYRPLKPGRVYVQVEITFFCCTVTFSESRSGSGGAAGRKVSQKRDKTRGFRFLYRLPFLIKHTPSDISTHMWTTIKVPHWTCRESTTRQSGANVHQEVQLSGQ